MAFEWQWSTQWHLMLVNCFVAVATCLPRIIGHDLGVAQDQNRKISLDGCSPPASLPKYKPFHFMGVCVLHTLCCTTCGWDGLMVGLNELRGLFLLSRFYDTRWKLRFLPFALGPGNTWGQIAVILTENLNTSCWESNFLNPRALCAIFPQTGAPTTSIPTRQRCCSAQIHIPWPTARG